MDAFLKPKPIEIESESQSQASKDNVDVKGVQDDVPPGQPAPQQPSSTGASSSAAFDFFDKALTDGSTDLEKDLESLFNRAEKEHQEEKDQEEVELKNIIDGGHLDLRSKWGLRFARSETGAKSDSYKGCREERSQFRIDWARAEFQKKVDKREKRTSYKKVDLKRGTYKPFSMISQNQGGKDDPGALEAAKKIARACIKMGGDWVYHNPMSGPLEVFDMQRGWESTFTQAWSLYQERSQEHIEKAQDKQPEQKEKHPEQADDDKEDKEKGIKTTSDKKGNKKAQAKKNNDDDPEEQGGKPEKRMKTDLDHALAEALQLKKDYATTVTTAQELQKRAIKEPGWEWAKVDLATLAALMEALSSSLTSFGANFLSSDLKVIRKDFKAKDQILTKELEQFSKSIGEKVKEVGKQTKLILATVSARNAVG